MHFSIYAGLAIWSLSKETLMPHLAAAFQRSMPQVCPMRRSRLARAALAALLTAGGPAWAQSAPAAGSDTQTITISATRRAEAIRDVPVSIVKLSTDNQLELGAKDLVDVLASVPGVTYNQTFGKSGSGEIVIRGVTTGNVFNPTVGIYIDDVPIGGTSGQNFGSSAFDQRLLDLSSIEVLKGPQGTLYGASAMGGLLKYNTRIPEDGFSGLFGGEASKTQRGGGNFTAYGHVNVPLSDKVAALRVALFHARDGGYIDATGPGGGSDVNSGKSTGARLSLGLKPMKGLDVRLSAQTQETKYDGLGTASYGTDGKPLIGDLIYSNLRFAQPTTQRADLVALNLEADLGFAKAMSITGYQKRRSRDVSDLNDGFLLVLPPFFDVTQLDIEQGTSLKKTTQEFRLVSPSGRTFEWIAGLFHANEKGDGFSNWTATTGPASPFPSGSLLLDNAGTATRWKETGLYGTLVWNASPALALTAGARASRNSLDQVQRNSGLITSNDTVATSTKESPDTYLLAARYKLSPSASVYARAASGYRAGGPNAPFLDPATGQLTSAAPYRSDSLWSYELGYKADLPNKLGSIDVALFQIDWKDLQVQVFNNGIGTNGNAGKARIRGLEFGGVVRPVPALTLRAAASLMDPKLLDDSPGLGGTAGERLPTAPKVAASLNARWDFSFGATPAYAALNLGHTGNRTVSFEASSTPNYRLPSYTVLDVQAGATVAGFDIGAYVRNLTDERGQVSAYTQFAGLGAPVQVNFVRPRTVGVTLSRAF
jgi:iron complex outermembrane recepter protein